MCKPWTEKLKPTLNGNHFLEQAILLPSSLLAVTLTLVCHKSKCLEYINYQLLDLHILIAIEEIKSIGKQLRGHCVVKHFFLWAAHQSQHCVRQRHSAIIQHQAVSTWSFPLCMFSECIITITLFSWERSLGFFSFTVLLESSTVKNINSERTIQKGFLGCWRPNAQIWLIQYERLIYDGLIPLKTDEIGSPWTFVKYQTSG